METISHAYQASPEVQRELDRMEARDRWPFLPARSYHEGNRQMRNYARQLLREPAAPLTIRAKRHHQDEVARCARNLGLHVELGHQLVTVSG